MTADLRRWLGVLCLIVLVAGCARNRTPETAPTNTPTPQPQASPMPEATPTPQATPTPNQFDRQEALANLIDEHVLPMLANFVAETHALEASVHQFSQEPTPANLEAVRTQWIETAAARARLEHLAFRFTMVLDSQIKKWPLDVRYVEQFIADPALTVDESLIESIGSTTKGLGAIEYLLFDPERESVDIVHSLAVDPRRMAYLVGLAENLTKKADELNRVWTSSGDNQARALLDADLGIGDTQDAINMLANALMAKTEEITNKGLYYPLTGSSGTPLPQAVESPYARQSIPLILSSLDGIRQSYDLLFADYLDFLQRGTGEALSDTIDQQFTAAIAAVEAISPSLAEAVVEDPQAVEMAYEEMKKLEILLKVDMANNLGVTVTYNARDGD